MKLSASNDDIEIIRKILIKYPYKIYAYGSRVKNLAKKSSDLDLCFMEAIPIEHLIDMHEEFEESDLPFRVELKNYNEFSDDFRKSIDADLIELLSII